MIHVIYNTQIYTFNHLQPIAQAAAIDGEKFLAVGTNDDILRIYKDQAVLHDLRNYTVIPGLTDSHIHLQHYALSLQMVNCETKTKAECLERVAERAKDLLPGAWIRGHGWNQNEWAEGFGSVADLDLVAPNNPVYLTAKSLHAAWVNSYTLRLCGIHSNTTDPSGGKIQKDDQDNPTGILFETAMNFVQSKIPDPSPAELAVMLKAAQMNLVKFGITSVHDFDRRDCFQALQVLQNTGNLHLRVIKNIPLEDLDHVIGIGLQSGFGNDYLRIGSVKLFADGALGPKTASMLQPYQEDGNNTGILMIDSETLFEIGQKAVRNGLSLAVHAIGDRANHEIINGFEHLRNYEKSNNYPRLRHRIEHVQLLHPGDLPRLASNHIIASMQPIHATSDMNMADNLWGDRAQFAYAWRTLLDHGTQLTFGSDAPVESPNPFLGIHAAVTRQRTDGSPGKDGWYPEQRLTTQQAFSGFITGPAITAGWENQSGKIASGYFADCVVLPVDPWSIPVNELAHIQPKATMIGGKWIWQEIPI